MCNTHQHPVQTLTLMNHYSPCLGIICFFINNSIFELIIELLRKVPRMWLKVTKQLLTIFSNLKLKCKKIDSKQPKVGKLQQFFILRLTSRLPNCFHFPKSEAQPGKNEVIYKRNMYWKRNINHSDLVRERSDVMLVVHTIPSEV